MKLQKMAKAPAVCWKAGGRFRIEFGWGWIRMTTEKLSLGQTGNREAL